MKKITDRTTKVHSSIKPLQHYFIFSIFLIYKWRSANLTEKPWQDWWCKNRYHMHRSLAPGIQSHIKTKAKPKPKPKSNQTSKKPPQMNKTNKKENSDGALVPPWKAKWHRKPTVPGLGRQYQQKNQCVVTELAEHPPSQFHLISITFLTPLFSAGRFSGQAHKPMIW